MAQTAQINVSIDTKNAIKSIGELNNEIGDSIVTVRDLQMTVSALQEELETTEVGTDRWKELKQAYIDANTELKNYELSVESLDNEQFAGELKSVVGGLTDMAGGFAPIKDCYKSLVYRLARYRNALGDAIPERVITREPSAELRPGQKDSDSLPDYEVLDPILEAFIEKDMSVDEITALGFDRAVVVRVLQMVKHNEYKRRQAPPGIRISSRAFGRDWRYPITSWYRFPG